MSRAVGTRGSFASQAGHAKLRKYQIKCRAGWWLARVPYGSWNRFETWEAASAWLTQRHGQRVANSRRRERVSRSS